MKYTTCMKQMVPGCLSLCLFAALACAGEPKTMNVQTKNGAIYSLQNRTSSVVAALAYGETVTVLEKENDWCKVSSSAGKTGWIHESALTTKKIKISSGGKDADVTASSGEMALAGKGFSKEVEAQFKSRNKDVDFSWVDKMEAMNVDSKALTSFMRDGKLGSASGKDGAK